MIKLTRVRTKAAVTSGLRGSGRVKKQRAIIDAMLDGSLDAEGSGWWNSGYWKKAKKQLKSETRGKCGYCEGPAAQTAYGSVEHYRPKDVYWWLGYCHDNYCYSCQPCNGKKSNHFPFHGTKMKAPVVAASLTSAQRDDLAARMTPDPVVDGAGMSLQDFQAAARAEKADLIDPYLEDPEPFFKWIADDILKEVEIRPRDNKARTKRVFEAAEKRLDINREDVRGARWTLAYEDLLEKKQLLDAVEAIGNDALKTQVLDGIRRLMEPRKPYAAMVRYFVKVEWGLIPVE